MNSRVAAVAGVLALVVLAGCSGLIGSGGTADREDTGRQTLTPAPVPETTSDLPTQSGQSAGPSRFASLRPTCDRPPELVTYIQLGALRTNDPRTDEGINTTWQFAAPSNRDAIGSYDRFANLLREQYRPLLDAETVTVGPLRRDGDAAEQPVTVTTGTGDRRSYVWYLQRQSGGRYDGCWMTTSVRVTFVNGDE